MSAVKIERSWLVLVICASASVCFCLGEAFGSCASDPSTNTEKFTYGLNAAERPVVLLSVIVKNVSVWLPVVAEAVKVYDPEPFCARSNPEDAENPPCKPVW